MIEESIIKIAVVATSRGHQPNHETSGATHHQPPHYRRKSCQRTFDAECIIDDHVLEDLSREVEYFPDSWNGRDLSPH